MKFILDIKICQTLIFKTNFRDFSKSFLKCSAAWLTLRNKTLRGMCAEEVISKGGAGMCDW